MVRRGAQRMLDKTCPATMLSPQAAAATPDPDEPRRREPLPEALVGGKACMNLMKASR